MTLRHYLALQREHEARLQAQQQPEQRPAFVLSDEQCKAMDEMSIDRRQPCAA